ncbi:hypothetical protein IWW37_005766 [Coemansia sp. RSA 2050]|nr:hypothetical protein IWW37_005766 [Coemansia sp. RSA 2050]KAJ2729126.1 hypothetical protein IW152_005729 [Coemansia sp. BCRC 34962]
MVSASPPADRPAPTNANTTTTQELDNLYNKLSNVSLALRNMDPATVPGTETTLEKPDQPSPTTDSGTASPKSVSEGGASDQYQVRNDGECDMACACQRVLLKASPGTCGLCGGRLGILTALNSERISALEDLEIATQRINELAHEKARHVDYIADLETRTSEQARKIDRQRDIIAGLKSDLSAMNDKFVDQVNTTAEIAHSRELVEAELEDLTQKLFTEANTMVASEKRARFDAEKSAAHLRHIITDLETRLAGETMQSQELKERIEQMSAEYDDLLLMKRTMAPSRRGSFGSHLSDHAGADGNSLRRDGGSVLTSGGAGGSMHGDGFRLAVHTAVVMAGTKSNMASPVAGSPMRLDEVLLAEFKEFAAQAQSARSTTYMSLPYIKNVINEDIEPCLRFGPRPRISSRNVLDAIASNRLQIEEMTPQIAAEMRRQQQAAERTDGHRRAMLWERFSGTVAANASGCQACGRECQCTYRFRMGLKADLEWIQIDTICRDRLVAACEFYGFVRYLRQGIFASRSIMDLYTETIRLRLCMFYARIGAYGYAIDLDPSLTEASLLTRNPSAPPLPESPSALSHSAPVLTASPTAAPYINVSRSGSTRSVTMLESGGNMPAPASQLGVGAISPKGNRYRSVSHEVSALPVPMAQLGSASQVSIEHVAEGKAGGAQEDIGNTTPDDTLDDDLDNEPLSSFKPDASTMREPEPSPLSTTPNP